MTLGAFGHHGLPCAQKSPWPWAWQGGSRSDEALLWDALLQAWRRMWRMWEHPAARQHLLRDPAAVRARGILGPCLTTALAAAWVWSRIPRVTPLSPSPEWARASSGRRALLRHRGGDPHPRGRASGWTQYPVLAASLRSRSKFHSQGLRVKFVLSH